MEGGEWKMESPFPSPFSFFPFPFSPFQRVVQQGRDAFGPGGGDQKITVGRGEGRPVYVMGAAGQGLAEGVVDSLTAL